MKCFYHSADLDGHCSGAIVKYKYPDCEMIGINYGQEFPWDKIKENEPVFMVDFSLPMDDMDRLDMISDELHWIDHHKTAIEEARQDGFLASGGQSLEIGKAGCELTWGYLFPKNVMPSGVYWLGRYDVWDHRDKNTLYYQYGFRTIKDSSPDNIELWKDILEGDISILQNGKLILEYEAIQNEKFCLAYAYEVIFNGYTAICANRGFCNSKVFDSVYDPEKYQLMITFCRTKNGHWKFSIYTGRDDVDCGKIAKKYGGGGHQKAAGFQSQALPVPFQKERNDSE